MVKNFSCAALFQPVDLNRGFEIATEVKKLHWKIDIGALAETELALEHDLLEGIVVNGLENIGVTDLGLLIIGGGQIFGHDHQLIEAERHRFAELDPIPRSGCRTYSKAGNGADKGG